MQLFVFSFNGFDYNLKILSDLLKFNKIIKIRQKRTRYIKLDKSLRFELFHSPSFVEYSTIKKIKLGYCGEGFNNFRERLDIMPLYQSNDTSGM